MGRRTKPRPIGRVLLGGLPFEIRKVSREAVAEATLNGFQLFLTASFSTELKQEYRSCIQNSKLAYPAVLPACGPQVIRSLRTLRSGGPSRLVNNLPLRIVAGAEMNEQFLVELLSREGKRQK